jgi:hypothetical protein
MVIGQSGIGLPLFYFFVPGPEDLSSGKSSFLLHVFLRRLTLKLPTALQTTVDRALLFTKGV